ncbi:hypothetical protein [Parapedobacter sp.]
MARWYFIVRVLFFLGLVYAYGKHNQSGKELQQGSSVGRQGAPGGGTVAVHAVSSMRGTGNARCETTLSNTQATCV